MATATSASTTVQTVRNTRNAPSHGAAERRHERYCPAPQRGTTSSRALNQPGAPRRDAVAQFAQRHVEARDPVGGQLSRSAHAEYRAEDRVRIPLGGVELIGRLRV